jgi:hypothetical protein
MLATEESPCLLESAFDLDLVLERSVGADRPWLIEERSKNSGQTARTHCFVRGCVVERHVA